MKAKLLGSRAVIGGLAVMALTLAPAMTGHDTAEAKNKGKHKGWSKQSNWKKGKHKGWSQSRTDWRRWDNNDRNWRDSRWRDSRRDDRRWDNRRDTRWRTNRSTSSNWRRSNARSDNWRRSNKTWQRNNNWQRTNWRTSNRNTSNWRRTNTWQNNSWRLADTDYYRSRDAARRAAAYSQNRGYRTSTSYDPRSQRWVVREYLRR